MELIQIVGKLRGGRKLAWWEWLRIGSAPMIVVPLLVLVGVEFPAWLVGAAVHFLGDFTFQSDEVAAGKVERGHYLWFHAAAVGGAEGSVAGF